MIFKRFFSNLGANKNHVTTRRHFEGTNVTIQIWKAFVYIVVFLIINKTFDL